MKLLAQKLLSGKLYVPTMALVIIVTAPVWVPVTIFGMLRNRGVKEEKGLRAP